MSPRRLVLACLIPLFGLTACGEKQPVAPDIEAQFGVASGPTLKAPSNTNAIAVSEMSSDSWIGVHWQDNSTNESGFEVHRSTTGASGSFSLVASTGAGVTSYGNTGLTPSTEHCYEVRALKNAGSKATYSSFSNVACATTFASPRPAAPSNVLATVNGPNGSGIGVTWTDNASNETGFRVERSATSGGPWTSLGTVAANSVSFQDSSPPAAEQPACYRVVAVNTVAVTPSSDVDCTTIPAGPSGVVAMATGSDVDVSWTDNSGVEDGFQLLRNAIVVATLPANTTTYRDDALAEGNYFYRVRATKDTGTSRESNEAAVGVFTTPPTATDCVYTFPQSSSRVEVRWCDVSAAAGFRIERSTDGAVTWVAAGTARPDVSEFYDVGLQSEYEACYRVVAFNSLGESQPSTVDCTTPPAAPTDLGLYTDEDGSLVLVWTDNSAVEDGYQAMGCFDDACPVVVLPPDSTSWRLGAISWWDGFQVAAIKDGGFSDWATLLQYWPGL